jgi:Ca2+-binding RTX toxin-like protein
VKGGDQDNSVTLRLAVDNPQVVQGDLGADGTPQFSLARTSIAAIDLKGGAGDDVLKIEDANGPFTATLSGGDGNDSLDGRQIKVATENDRYRGGAGNDLVAGSKGTDTALLGSGDDTFRWDNGEGSDVVEGDDGYDTLVFDGAGVSEQATLSANDGRLSFFRTQGNVLDGQGRCRARGRQRRPRR